MIVLALFLIALVAVLVLLHVAHRAPVSALDEALSAVDEQLDRPTVERMAA